MYDRRVEDELGGWVKRMSGCVFAKRFTSSGQIAMARMGALADTTPEEVTQFFLGASQEERAAVAIFPLLRSEAEVVELLALLAGGGPRWQVREHTDGDRAGLLVSVRWKTDYDAWSSAMGLGPLLTMPVTRRAPYVALAAWPGKGRKPHQPVGFIDMPSGLPRDQHRSALNASMKEAEHRLGEDPNRAPWREVAFCLHESSRDALALAARWNTGS